MSLGPVAYLKAQLSRWAAPLVLLALVASTFGGYRHGVDVAATRCAAATAGAQMQGHQQAASAAQVAITKGVAVGRVREVFRADLDRTFDTFIQEAAREPPTAVDDCVLPDERLRRWADANAGAADSSAPTSEPNDATSAPTGPGLRPRARPGSQPLGGDQGLPPAGEPALPAADVSGPAP